MNMGTDYTKAKAQARANADLTRHPWVLHMYNRVWWVSRLDSYTEGLPADAEIVYPRPETGT